jgi:hypothetical protein
MKVMEACKAGLLGPARRRGDLMASIERRNRPWRAWAWVGDQRVTKSLRPQVDTTDGPHEVVHNKATGTFISPSSRTTVAEYAEVRMGQ